MSEVIVLFIIEFRFKDLLISHSLKNKYFIWAIAVNGIISNNTVIKVNIFFLLSNICER